MNDCKSLFSRKCQVDYISKKNPHPGSLISVQVKRNLIAYFMFKMLVSLDHRITNIFILIEQPNYFKMGQL